MDLEMMIWIDFISLSDGPTHEQQQCHPYLPVTIFCLRPKDNKRELSDQEMLNDKLRKTYYEL